MQQSTIVELFGKEFVRFLPINLFQQIFSIFPGLDK